MGAKKRFKYEWGKIKDAMCCRCKKKATNFFIKRGFFRREERGYCDEHLLERLKEEELG